MAEPNLSFYVNDGKSLEMIKDHSIDFIFSFDSLVHAEGDVIKTYLSQLARKLKSNGVGFTYPEKIIHDSSPMPRGTRMRPKRCNALSSYYAVFYDRGAWRIAVIHRLKILYLLLQKGLNFLFIKKPNMDDSTDPKEYAS